MRQRSAFSLVELSVVLVIIGLITGGVLMGQTFMRSAEIKSVGIGLGQYKAATVQFRTQYGWLPGDMPNATSYWGKDNTNCAGHSGSVAANGTCNGNGNQQITGGTWVEDVRAWQQLGLSGIINGSYTGVLVSSGLVSGTNIPASKIRGAGFQMNYWSNVLSSGMKGNGLQFGMDVAGAYNTNGVLKGDDTQALDVKMDDGFANRGNFQATRGSNYSTGCVSGTAPNLTYDFLSGDNSCYLIYLF